MHNNSQQLTVDSLFCEPSMRTCGTPQTPEETTKKYLLMAQFKFEQHVCSTYDGDQARSA